MAVIFEKMTAEIDLMNNRKIYVVKDGRLIEHDLPEYGESLVITLRSKVGSTRNDSKTEGVKMSIEMQISKILLGYGI